MLFNRPMLKLTAIKVGCNILKARDFKLPYFSSLISVPKMLLNRPMLKLTAVQVGCYIRKVST